MAELKTSVFIPQGLGSMPFPGSKALVPRREHHGSQHPSVAGSGAPVPRTSHTRDVQRQAASPVPCARHPHLPVHAGSLSLRSSTNMTPSLITLPCSVQLTKAEPRPTCQGCCVSLWTGSAFTPQGAAKHVLQQSRLRPGLGVGRRSIPTQRPHTTEAGQALADANPQQLWLPQSYLAFPSRAVGFLHLGSFLVLGVLMAPLHVAAPAPRTSHCKATQCGKSWSCVWGREPHQGKYIYNI